SVFREELRRHESERREREHHDRQLEAETEGEHHREHESEVLLGGDERNHGLGPEAHQPRKRQRDDDLERERRARDEQGRSTEQHADRNALFVLVERGREEQPDLIENDRRREHEAAGHRRVQRDAELVAWMREEEMVLGEQREDWAREDLHEIEAQRDPETDADANDHRGQRIDDSPAQLLEMIEARHFSVLGLRNPHRLQQPHSLGLSRSLASSASGELGYSLITRLNTIRASG